MNPPPDPYIYNTVAIIFASICIFYFVKALNDPSKTIDTSDLFTIGYINDPYRTSINIRNKVIQSQKPNFESQQLYIDCIDALCAIGMKKTEAKNKAKAIFSTMSNPPTTVQDFLMIALRSE